MEQQAVFQILELSKELGLVQPTHKLIKGIQ
jgi:hypothetical protein